MPVSYFLALYCCHFVLDCCCLVLNDCYLFVFHNFVLYRMMLYSIKLNFSVSSKELIVCLESSVSFQKLKVNTFCNLRTSEQEVAECPVGYDYGKRNETASPDGNFKSYNW